MGESAAAGASATTARGRATRQALVDAAWELLDELPLHELLADVSVEEVAADAGVTSGSFFHHFASREEFVDAMVLDLLDNDTEDPSWVAAGELRHIALGGPPSDVRRQVDAFLGSIEHEGRRQAFRRLLLVLTRPPDSTVAGRRLADLLVERYWRPADRSQQVVWELTLELTDRWPRRPFDVPTLTRVLQALGTGSRIRRLAVPDSIPRDVLAAAALAIVAAASTPSHESIGLDELEVGLDRGFAANEDGTDARRRAVAAEAVAVVDDGWERVSLARVAARLGTTAADLTSLFTNVRRLAAYGFYAVLEPANWFDPAMLDEEPPEPDAVVRAIVEAARAHPDLARAHAAERNLDTVRLGLVHGTDDVRLSGSLGAELMRAHLRAAEDGSVSMASMAQTVVTVVDVALTLGLRPEMPVDRVVEVAVEMLAAIR